MAATSFQRKTRAKNLQIAGSKPSLYNNQLLISSGIPSLDSILGGGLAVGSVLLVEEDNFGNYGRLLLKYFCAEAVMTGHSLLLSSADQSPDQIIKELPAPIIDDPGSVVTRPEEEGSEKMSIAWRYQHLPKFQSNPTTVKFGHYYDLTKVMDPALVNSCDCSCVGQTDLLDGDLNGVMNPKYRCLLKTIKEKIDRGGFSTAKVQEKRNILRIGIHSLGSPQWGENGGFCENHEDLDYSLPRFLLALRSILRTAFGVCIITIPTHLFKSATFVSRLERLCDTVVHLESFAGSDKEKNPAYKEYHGLFHIRQLPRLNSLTSHMPDTLDFAFKLRRKKFTIEKLHLPPELSDTASRPQEDAVPNLRPGVLSCGTVGSKSKLDF
ncbi:elongator complex protein 4-like [Mizuhopecten yessoensis]|uniref:elongator complex protein 4-like n=1 Tax=Mizuhopecten yessoensis TaxID=6573 RepID=UPI000B45DCE9|nr:elongator complex protein 4-like [Mizuhopecten yessoensis]